MNKNLFGLLFLICVNFYSAESCSCGQRKSYEKYCRAEWVANIKVLDVEVRSRDIFEYTIEYIKVFRMPQKFNETFPTKIYSFTGESMCGLTLRKNQIYVLLGRVTDAFLNDGGPGNVIGVNHCELLMNEFAEKLKNGTLPDDLCMEGKIYEDEEAIAMRKMLEEWEVQRWGLPLGRQNQK